MKPVLNHVRLLINESKRKLMIFYAILLFLSLVWMDDTSKLAFEQSARSLWLCGLCFLLAFLSLSMKKIYQNQTRWKLLPVKKTKLMIADVIYMSVVLWLFEIVFVLACYLLNAPISLKMVSFMTLSIALACCIECDLHAQGMMKIVFVFITFSILFVYMETNVSLLVNIIVIIVTGLMLRKKGENVC